MITAAEARAIMLEQIEPMRVQQVALPAALGRTLRETITANRPQPPFVASAMDGYAVRAADTPGVLRCVGEASAGGALKVSLGAGECARIFTGAPLPEGADAVLIQEDAERHGDDVTAPHIDQGTHVRRAGVDFQAGEVLLEPSRMLDPLALALAAAAGRAELSVSSRPRVAILSGGDEIIPPGAAPRPDQIFDSVSYGVAAFADLWGASVSRHTPFEDDPALIARCVNEALADVDLAVVIGGASVGDHDHARPAMKAIGAEILFDKVALRPGKPTWFARRDTQLVLGLPGNPASAFVCAHLFLRPLLDHMLGRAEAGSARQNVRLRGALGENGPREAYLRARVAADAQGQLWAHASLNQDSSLIRVFSASNALLVRAPDAPPVAEGELVDALML